MTRMFTHPAILHLSERSRVLSNLLAEALVRAQAERPWFWPAMVSLTLSSPAFICCWSPYFLFDMLDNFSFLPDTKERFYASVIIQNLPTLNSAINPLIYCIFSSSMWSR